MTTNDIIEYCMNRVENVFNKSKSEYKTFFQEESGNMLFLTMHSDCLASNNFKYSTNLISAANSAQTRFALKRMNQHIDSNTNKNEWSLTDFHSLLKASDWTVATSLFTLCAIEYYSEEKTRLEIYDAGVAALQNIVTTQNLPIALQFFKTGKLKGMLKVPDENLLYFITHVLFVVTEWGNAHYEFTPTLKSSCVQRINEYLDQFSETQMILNLEIILELAVCLRLLGENNNENSHIKTVDSLLVRLKTSEKHGYLVLPNNNQTNVYGKRYFWHADYHLHFLIAYFLTMKKQ